MVQYYFRKLLIFALSMAIAVSLIILSFSVLTVGLFHSDAFVASGLEKNSGIIIEASNAELEKTAKRLSIPPELLTEALTEENTKVVVNEVAHNFIYGYTTAFSNSTELYSLFVNAVSARAGEFNLKFSDVQVSRIASLAVDAVNEALASTDTAMVSVFNFSQSKMMMFAIIFSIVVLIGSIVALDMLNNGRHRKYNYIGMGMTAAGAVMVTSTALILYKGYLNSYRFCAFEAYDLAVKYCMLTLYKAFAVIGILIFIAGFIMLVSTYRYFAIKKQAHMATRLTDDDRMTDYMDDYYTKNMRTHIPGEEFEKEVKKINFDE